MIRTPAAVGIYSCAHRTSNHSGVPPSCFCCACVKSFVLETEPWGRVEHGTGHRQSRQGVMARRTPRRGDERHSEESILQRLHYAWSGPTMTDHPCFCAPSPHLLSPAHTHPLLPPGLLPSSPVLRRARAPPLRAFNSSRSTRSGALPSSAAAPPARSRASSPPTSTTSSCCSTRPSSSSELSAGNGDDGEGRGGEIEAFRPVDTAGSVVILFWVRTCLSYPLEFCHAPWSVVCHTPVYSFPEALPRRLQKHGGISI